MKTLCVILCLFFGTTTMVPAQGNPYLSNTDVKLSPSQWHAIELVNSWVKSNVPPSIGDNGTLVFPYGASMPFLIAMPLYPAKISFEPSETIVDYHIGDAARWKLSPGISGTPPNQVHHIILKPVDSGLRTALIVNTNKRSYYIHLISRKKNLIPNISFSYPESEDPKWQAFRDALHQQQRHAPLTQNDRNSTTLDFEYKINGNAPFKPLRVYNNGHQTIIQMPKNIATQDAPSLLVLTPDHQRKIVNYRIKKERYIVDELFQKAILISGIGDTQQIITIRKKGAQ